MSNHPDTIVLIHGLWMTPRSWESFQDFYIARGYRVLAPAWPRLVGDVEEIRKNPGALAGLGLTEIVEHYAALIRPLPQPPILIGHSIGGLIVQLLLDRGLGRCGVAIDSAAPRGVLALPWTQIRAGSPVLVNPLNYWRTVALTFAQFNYAFTHIMPEREARAAYARYAIPGPGRPLFQMATGNFNPWAANRINFRNLRRAPLLLIAGEQDHLIPPVLNRSNHRLYRHSAARTDFKEFPHRSHFIVGQEGWREVAEYAVDWARAATRRAELPAPAAAASRP